MTPENRGGHERAERYRSRAISYREDAVLLLEQYGKPDSAYALIYEAAKQCINAVANQQGGNPGATGTKTRYLSSIASQSISDQFDLERGWEAAMRLHIHADRGHLDTEAQEQAWLLAQVFIDDMLSVYSGEG